MNKKNPLITIVIPTYNRRKLLEKALNSAINQTYKNLEILISDNHSKDGTEEFCKMWEEKDSRIKYFRHDKNIGMTNNNNFIHKKVRGEYFVILCDDDWLDLDYVEKCFDFFKKHPKYVQVSPISKMYDENHTYIKTCNVVKLDNLSIFSRMKHYISSNFQSIIVTGLFKTSVAKEIQELEGNLYKDRFMEDWVFELKYLTKGKCKVLTNTYYNKLNNGATSDIKTLNQLWDVEGFTEDNILIKSSETISKIFLEDIFFNKNLSKKWILKNHEKLGKMLIPQNPINIRAINFIKKNFLSKFN